MPLFDQVGDEISQNREKKVHIIGLQRGMKPSLAPNWVLN
jgi:hypothetical protein